MKLNPNIPTQPPVKTVTSLGECRYLIFHLQGKSILDINTRFKPYAVFDDKGQYVMNISQEKLDWFLKEGLWEEKER